jgi:uncharacterized protein (TIGR03435 family)
MMRAVSIAILFVVLFGCTPCALADSEVKVGSPAPRLTLRNVLQAPKEIHGTWEELKGKAVVIEFWATWCGGCVDNIPHMNKLAEEFESRPLQFISVTDETDDELVKRFLGRHPISGWVAFDADEGTFKRYGIEGRPQTVLVDATGIVRALTSPTSVTPQVLEDLLAGKSLDFPEIHKATLLGLEAGAPQPLLQVLIRPAAPVALSGTSPGGIFDRNGRYDVYGKTLRNILSDTYQIPEGRVDAPDWCRSTRYDFSVVTPQHEEQLRGTLLKQILEAAFQLKLHEEMKETSVYILRRIDGQQPKLQQAATSGKSSHLIPAKGEAESMNASIGAITHLAQYVLGKEVLDETGLTDRYDFSLKWDANQPTSLVIAIRNQLGLELVADRRKMNHLVVDSIKETQTW